MSSHCNTCTYLLALEDVLIELLLQALIGQVDAQLLKAVLLEGLEAINVQNTDGAVRSPPSACRSTWQQCQHLAWPLLNTVYLATKH